MHHRLELIIPSLTCFLNQTFGLLKLNVEIIYLRLNSQQEINFDLRYVYSKGKYILWLHFI